jgi:hypothetical protein
MYFCFILKLSSIWPLFLSPLIVVLIIVSFAVAVIFIVVVIIPIVIIIIRKGVQVGKHGLGWHEALDVLSLDNARVGCQRRARLLAEVGVERVDLGEERKEKKKKEGPIYEAERKEKKASC